MVLLIDDNVVLDVLQNRQPHYKHSRFVWEMCGRGNAEGYISALTFADIVYIMRKEVAYDEIADLLSKVSKIFRFVDLTLDELRTAANMKWRDFEDAVQSATASRIHADYIITRNTDDYAGSTVRAITPEEYFSDVFTAE
ncbi:MAG: PIN domain-containing protein [Synergistaceae bacterium]|nr:PIN domain-containing protein [Synergistaceae bacterium]MBQ7169842.1 PIN domain-containing protein [Synergistaceae bacterium]